MFGMEKAQSVQSLVFALFDFGGTFFFNVDKIIFSPKRTDLLFIEHRCFSFFAGEVSLPKCEPDHHFHFVTNSRMNGALPLLIFYDS